MRNTGKKNGGFTLIELLIVIAIIGILAAVLIPNLLNARARAFDTAAQSCLKEIATQEEINASNAPWQYTKNILVNAGAAVTAENKINSCTGVVVTAANPTAANGQTAGTDNFGYTAKHKNGSNNYIIANGTGVATGTTNP